MSKADILLIGPIYQPKLEQPEFTYACHRYWSREDREARVASLSQRCEIAVTSGGRGMSTDEMDLLPRLRLIACFGV